MALISYSKEKKTGRCTSHVPKTYYGHYMETWKDRVRNEAVRAQRKLKVDLKEKRTEIA